VGERSRASAPCPFSRPDHAFSPGGEPASASCRVWLTGVGNRMGPAGRLHSRVLLARPNIPAIAGAEECYNPCPQGRGSRVIVAGTHVRIGNRCLCACLSLVARVHLRWVRDAGGTVLIDPSSLV
jgi:hypothetical protein